MNFEVGKKYKTVNGTVVTITQIENMNTYTYPIKGTYLVDGETKYESWAINGTLYNDPEPNNGFDLIEDYIPEEVLQAAEQHYEAILAEEPAELEKPMDYQHEESHPSAYDEAPARPPEPVKPTIDGYRQLTPSELGAINRVKALGAHIEAELKILDDGDVDFYDLDPRWFAMGKTDLQRGLMAIVRSISRPTNF